MKALLRYDGRFDFIPQPLDRQWTVLSHWLDSKGRDRFMGSFSVQGLHEIGILA